MLSIYLNKFRQTMLLYAVLLFGLPGLACAVSSTDFVSLPPTSGQNSTYAKPLVMLLLGKDDSLYKKAYTDLVDLDGDGIPDNTYKNAVEYFGYFNPNTCYVYDLVNNLFTPSVSASSHYCTGSAGKYWSGNFLNWATMTRMDVFRKVLYGGLRSTDTGSATVLERAYFPTDAHSFAKYYNGADLGDLTPFNGSASAITICNTTPASSGDSQNVTNPPLMRIAKGDFRRWAANERWQCTWKGEKTTNAVVPNVPNDNDPDESIDGLPSNGAGPNYVVRVEVCDAGALNQTNCTQYPNGNYKPTGLLQTYGESGKIQFGLMTGSYSKNKSGGVLRKNISDFSNEVDSATNGTFTGVAGIVKTLNALRMHGYDNEDGEYNDHDNCPWGLSSFNEPNCSNWGNPMSEMYLEAVRYFKGLSANFNTDDSSYIPGLGTPPSWTAPLNANNWCAKCSIIVLNTGPFSYDADQITTGFSQLTGTTTAQALTKQIGDWESITGNNWFIGSNGTNNDGLCTPKTVTDLSLAIGPCPDAPRLGGSFDMAGIAYWAHTNNLNNAAPAGQTQSVNTYTVGLSPTTPIINIPVPGDPTRSVKLMPACQDTWSSGSTQTPGDCRMVDMQIITPYTVSGSTATGDIYVNWEDSEQGGDFDQDMWGIIHYSITGSSITITTKTSYESSSFRMGFGYVISGTMADGFHVHSGVNNYSYTDPYAGILGCTGCNVSDTATSQAYLLGSGTAGVLEDPLWYTAKYGGFIDINSTHTITSAAQWDNRSNSTNAYGADGVPDNYFTSSNPGRLVTDLGRVLANITERVSSGTATAVIANSGTGTGMLVQALYQPLVTNSAKSQRITWVGLMHALFLDIYNNLREDSNQNGQLDDYATDKVVQIFYDATSNQTEIARFDTADGKTLTLNSIAPLSDLKPIWNVRDQLATLNNSDIPTQRMYNTQISPTNGRYIFTAIDSNNDGIINDQDVIPFTDTDIDSTNFGWMNIQTDFNGDTTIDAADADQVVDYVRGEEGVNAGFRSRTIDYDQDNVDEVWRLGDIIDSTPVIESAPNGAWDTKYTDPTYTNYRTQYANRRVVIYTGANDGMLHAFNGGFFDAINKRYDLTRSANAYESAAPTAHPLGSELWAYVPSNLLPHLQWLTEPDYPHVYYVDGNPQAFDVNIFTPGVDAHGIDHPDGWGTILVVGMRLGGGSITYSPEAGRTVTSRSAYVIMDITDPEQPPVLLGEISDPALGYTTSTPSLLVKRAPGSGSDWSNPAVNKWYLVFGSGPTNLTTVTSNQNAGLYILDLNTMGFVSGFAPKNLGIANSFVGDTRSVDWTKDFSYDASYFGIVGGGTGASPSAAPDGRLMRMVAYTNTPGNWSTSTVINPSQPFANRPEVAVDEKGKWWLYAGTGRLYVPDDNKSTNQQSFYGIKEQVNTTTGLPDSTTATVSASSYQVQNTTGVQVFVDGSIQDPLSVLPNGVTNFDQLVSLIDGMAGWYINFATPATGSERNLGPSTMFRLLTVFTAYTPAADTCLSEGSSDLYAVYYKTGTAYPNAGLGNVPCANCGVTNDPDLTQSSIPVGTGLIREVSVIGGGACEGSNCGTAIGGSSTGAVLQSNVTGVPSTSGRQSWREIISQ